MAVYIQLVLAMLFYGISFVSTKIALVAYGPLTVLMIRLALSSVFLIALDALVPEAAGPATSRTASGAGGRPPEPVRPRRPKWPARSDTPAILLVTLFQPLMYFIAENFGLRLVSASIASIIIATIPVVTPLVAGPFLGERLNRWGVAGLVLSLAGVAIIVLERRIEAQFTPLGLVLVFIAVLAAVFYSVAVRKAPARYRPLTLVKMQSLIGLPIILTMALIAEGAPATLPEPRVALHLIYLGLFPSSLAFVFLSTGIRRLGASRANVFTNLVPGFTAVFAWLLVGEQFTLQKVLGMLIVVAGVLTAQRGRRTAAGKGVSR